MEILTKRFASTKAEADEGGNVRAVIATLEVEDSDRDVTLPGAFGRQAVKFIPAHDWESVWLGKGEVFEDGAEVRAEIAMNLEIPAAKDWHSALRFDLAKGPRPLAEFSYGYRILPGGSSVGEWQGREVRFLRPRPDGSPGLEVFEVSPVLKGAGVGTRLEGVKGFRFADEIADALGRVKGVCERARSIISMREREGRGLAPERVAQLEAIKAALLEVDGLRGEIDQAIRGPDPLPDPGVLFLELQRTNERLSRALAGAPA